MEYDIKSEFGKRAKQFRLKFGLSQKELGELSGMSPSEYGVLEKGITNYSVEKLQKVAAVYGMVYYQFGNPECGFPTFDMLPNETRKAIISREKPLKIYNDRLIIEYLTLILGELSIGSKFLVKNLRTKINKKYSTQYEDSEISGTISKNFSEYVIKTDDQYMAKEGPGAKPFYYKLIKRIPIHILAKAKEKIRG